MCGSQIALGAGIVIIIIIVMPEDILALVVDLAGGVVALRRHGLCCLD